MTVEEDNETTDHQDRTRPPGSTRATRQPGITCVKIIKGIITGPSLNFTSAKHDSCLYQGTIDGHDIFLLSQVDEFSVAAPTQAIANILFAKIQVGLTQPLKTLGLINIYNFQMYNKATAS